MNFYLLRRAGVYLFLSVAAFVSVFPFIWMALGATNKSTEIVTGKLTPGSNLLVNLQNLMAQVDLVRVFGNSFFIAIVSTILTLAISSLAGYGFEIFRSRVRERIFQLLLLLLSIPFAALMVPLFVMISRVQLTNTFTAVILPSIASIFIVFYFRQATKAFPADLRDAARVDGLKEWQIFLFVYLPTMRSTYAAATIIVFMGAWNNYLWPLIVLQTPENKTITLVISTLTAAYTPDYGVILLTTVLATLPTLVIFFVLQRQFVQGMLGAVK
ncbi:carbohydrate ABC transporter permease [Devosia sp. FJ2-5-3]|jgi:lactose/L-arabinose transport system permease protein|uniref:carbohydrate ABC transporter permease n=1 Tax=Devosia sp. FJ2-5-3 TaxID=2976680 RepID=UPI0023D881E2|nr:carbohydrate ABC transporter permease [Devosia sp. FJ2-5-3]WEJ57308.1 carbohydrate ABC transporter permease [Devosia sp. FJ2-5-3]